jgi:hypothetical protein
MEARRESIQCRHALTDERHASHLYLGIAPLRRAMRFRARAKVWPDPPLRQQPRQGMEAAAFVVQLPSARRLGRSAVHCRIEVENATRSSAMLE